jgi:hypothetical protein
MKRDDAITHPGWCVRGLCSADEYGGEHRGEPTYLVGVNGLVHTQLVQMAVHGDLRVAVKLIAGSGLEVEVQLDGAKPAELADHLATVLAHVNPTQILDGRR